jgi:hypothetical protein
MATSFVPSDTSASSASSASSDALALVEMDPSVSIEKMRVFQLDIPIEEGAYLSESCSIIDPEGKKFIVFAFHFGGGNTIKVLTTPIHVSGSVPGYSILQSFPLNDKNEIISGVMISPNTKYIVVFYYNGMVKILSLSGTLIWEMHDKMCSFKGFWLSNEEFCYTGKVPTEAGKLPDLITFVNLSRKTTNHIGPNYSEGKEPLTAYSLILDGQGDIKCFTEHGVGLTLRYNSESEKWEIITMKQIYRLSCKSLTVSKYFNKEGIIAISPDQKSIIFFNSNLGGISGIFNFPENVIISKVVPFGTGPLIAVATSGPDYNYEKSFPFVYPRSILIINLLTVKIIKIIKIDENLKERIDLFDSSTFEGITVLTFNKGNILYTITNSL